MQMQWFLYFLCYVQTAQPVPSTKVQASSMTANTILMAYEFTGSLYTGLWRYVTLGVTIMMVTLIIDIIDGSDICVCHLLLGSHLGYCDMFFD